MPTYYAHIPTAAAGGLDDPVIVVLADDGSPGGTVIETLDLPPDTDCTEVLDEHGWQAAPEPAADQHPEPGGGGCAVTPMEWIAIVGRVTAHRDATQAAAERAAAGWRRVVADAVRDRSRGAAVQTLAETAGIGRSRAYQIADELRASEADDDSGEDPR